MALPPEHTSNVQGTSGQQIDHVIDMRRLRGLLAERRITHTVFASVCGLSRTNVGRFLAGSRRPGERARLRLALGMQIMGLDRGYDERDTWEEDIGDEQGDDGEDGRRDDDVRARREAGCAG